jgi:preprotein translocase subunit YajC
MNDFLMLQAATPGSNPSVMFITMGGMFAVMYFFMIRPQQKKAKEQKAFAESMNPGEYVITTAGIHGTINRSYDDGTIQVEVGKGNFLKLERSAISLEMTMAYRKKNNIASATADVASK